MTRRGPIKVLIPKDEDVAVDLRLGEIAEVMTLPGAAALDAGIKKFMEYANLHWPAGRTADESFKLTSFDYRNDYHLRVTLGMVYMAMREADDAG